MNVFRWAEAPFHAPRDLAPAAAEPRPASPGDAQPYHPAYAGAPIVSALVGRRPGAAGWTSLPASAAMHRVGTALVSGETPVRGAQSGWPGAVGTEPSGSRNPSLPSALRGGRPGDRDDAQQSRAQDLRRDREAQHRALATLGSNEREARRLLGRTESDKQNLQAEIAELRANGEDVGAHERLLASLDEQLARLRMLVRDTQNAQYGALGAVRDIERQLDQLAQLRDQYAAGPSAGRRR
jgi:hypothetical protein